MQNIYLKQYIWISAEQIEPQLEKKWKFQTKFPISNFYSENCTRACYIDFIWLDLIMALLNSKISVKD